MAGPDRVLVLYISARGIIGMAPQVNSEWLISYPPPDSPPNADRQRGTIPRLAEVFPMRRMGEEAPGLALAILSVTVQPIGETRQGRGNKCGRLIQAKLGAWAEQRVTS